LMPTKEGTSFRQAHIYLFSIDERLS
jgi:hypothetical protein